MEECEVQIGHLLNSSLPQHRRANTTYIERGGRGERGGEKEAPISVWVTRVNQCLSDVCFHWRMWTDERFHCLFADETVFNVQKFYASLERRRGSPLTLDAVCFHGGVFLLMATPMFSLTQCLQGEWENRCNSLRVTRAVWRHAWINVPKINTIIAVFIETVFPKSKWWYSPSLSAQWRVWGTSNCEDDDQ